MSKRPLWKRPWPRISPRTAPGTPPGTIGHDPTAQPPVVRVIAYDDGAVADETVHDLARIRDLKEHWSRIWVNVDGLGDGDTISTIGEIFGLHPLALEDVANANLRPKVEDYPGHAFVVVRMPELHGGVFRTEQCSLFFGEGFVVTFQERTGDCFEPVRKRFGNILRERFLDSDYLAYTLLDAIVDSFFPILEAFAEQLESLEERIGLRPTPEIIREIFHTKHALLGLRRAIWPARDVLNALIRDPQYGISESTRMHLRDCYDHAARIIDLVETYRELGAGMMELYQSVVGQRLNETMKVLTIIATVFIPPTLIAGVYGMNFKLMPELDWYLGYPFALLLMALLMGGMFAYFRRKRWIGGGAESPGGGELEARPAPGS